MSDSVKIVFCFVFLLTTFSCEQYDYTSPLPGVLEVRLAVVNNRQNLIPFGPGNNFGLTMESLEARQPGGTRLLIFSDLHAIRRNPLGDYFNCLDTLARDSMFVLGQTYAPPGTFSALEFRVSPDPIVVISYGFYFNFIDVVLPQLWQSLQRVPGSGEVLNINIEEGRLTRVTVTFDLDNSLLQRTERFEYRPRFYVSSVQVF